MDYLIFMTGLFLLAAGTGGFFLYREDCQVSRWPLLALALIALGGKFWFGLIVFALGLEGPLLLLHPLLAAVCAASLLGFALSPLIEVQRRAFITKWAGMVAVFGIVFIAGTASLQSLWFIGPILAVSLFGGWQIAGFSDALVERRKKSTHPLTTALPLAVVVAVSLLPGAVEAAYDALGEGESQTRITILVALTAATAASAILCWRLWSIPYRKNRGQLSRSLLRRRRIGTSVILAAALFTALNGAWLAHWLGNQAGKQQTSTLLGALVLGAKNLDVSLIDQIEGKPDEIALTPFLTLHRQLREIRTALPRTRFAYLLGMRERQLVFLADSEDPASADTFSPPGMRVEVAPGKWLPALAGNSVFFGPYRDRWGVWFSATVPVVRSDGKPAGLLVVDYPAASWLQPLAARRLAAMGVTLSAALLLIALFGIHLITIQASWRVEGLSTRLSDAMAAAGFDTWECFPKPFQLLTGESIAATLGWAVSPTFRQVWKQVHPDDRSQLFKLVRQQRSSEAEVRLRDAHGHWLWFMIRGRVVHSQPKDALRLVGTVLNIDDHQRSRLETDRQRRFAQQVMESVPNGLAVIGADGLISYANAAFVRLARSSPQALIGLPISSFLSSTDDAHDYNTLPGRGYEATLTGLDGTQVPVQAFRAPLPESHHDGGSILAVLDLTAAKRAELALVRSRAEANRLALVAKRTDSCVVITDAGGLVEWVNDGFTKLSGYTPEEVLGKSPGALLQRADFEDPTRRLIRESIRAGRGFDVETTNHTKNGRSYLVHIECQPLFDTHGRLTGFMAIERDITQTRRTANLLEAVSSISSTLLSKRVEPAVWVEILAALGRAADVDHCHLFELHPEAGADAPRARQLATWTAGDAPPLAATDEIPLVHRWHRELLAGREIRGLVSSFPDNERASIAAHGVRSLVIVPVLTADHLWGFLRFDSCQDDRVWESWGISILRSAAANIGLYQVARHESDALVLARDAAEKANRAKSTFLATMSHEIRTPLNAVIGMASLLETTTLNPQQQDFAETILTSGNFLLELINDILDYSRIESGKIELDASTFFLADLCREAFDVVRLGAMGKRIELTSRIGPRLPARLVGDRARIRQILVNLLNNAVKFTPGGFVTLNVDGREDVGGQWNLTFEVKDSGIGISPDALDKLFRPFIQEDSSTTRRFGGSGLGLAISKRLAGLMGGDITVRSSLGEGSTFVVTITLLPAAPGNFQEAPVTPTLADPAAIARLGQLRVLVAEDNLNNQKIINLLLIRLGIEPHIVADGQLALDAAAAAPYDIILMDLQMPVMDGLEASRRIRALGGPHRPSIIALTANVFQEDRDASTAAGMDDYLSKPITLDRLREKFLAITRSMPGSDAPELEPESESKSEPASVVDADAILINPRQLEPLAILGIKDFHEILGDVVRDVPGCLESLRAAIHAGDIAALKARAHSLRGMLGNFGCVAMTARLAQIEHLESIDPTEADAVQTELQQLWDQSLAAIKAWEKAVPEFAEV